MFLGEFHAAQSQSLGPRQRWSCLEVFTVFTEHDDDEHEHDGLDYHGNNQL